MHTSYVRPRISQAKYTKNFDVPVKNEKRELSILNDLFVNIKIIVINDWKTHDRYMSILLSLAYYINILFAQSLTDQDIPSLKSLSGTSFAIQSLLSESMLTDQPSLITSLFIENPFVIDLVRKYNSQAATFAEYISVRDKRKIKSLIEDTKDALSKNIDLVLRIRNSTTFTGHYLRRDLENISTSKQQFDSQ